MTPTLRAELDRIEAFLAGDEGADLGVILAALRGPDDEDLRKKSLTIHVRRAAFPRLARKLRFWGVGKLWTLYLPKDAFVMPPSPSLEDVVLHRDHFLSHIRDAAKVLEMDK